MVTLLGNLGIILVIRADLRLHTPMHYFLSHLAFVDTCCSSVTVPQMLVHVLEGEKTIACAKCAAQLGFFVVFGVTECLLLAAMAYGRYVATCNPSCRRKAFSTCAPHLAVVTMFYGAILFMYLRPGSTDTLAKDKATTLFYTVMTPMLNPFIYSLRNMEVKIALKRAVYRLQ
ncbi:olfactory receptor 8U9-like [Eudromia elegans]